MQFGLQSYSCLDVDPRLYYSDSRNDGVGLRSGFLDHGLEEQIREDGSGEGSGNKWTDFRRIDMAEVVQDEGFIIISVVVVIVILVLVLGFVLVYRRRRIDSRNISGGGGRDK